jgi:hypothetical protein
MGLLLMACLAFLTILPASRLPDYRPGEIPDAPPPVHRLPAPELDAGFEFEPRASRVT